MSLPSTRLPQRGVLTHGGLLVSVYIPLGVYFQLLSGVHLGFQCRCSFPGILSLANAQLLRWLSVFSVVLRSCSSTGVRRMWLQEDISCKPHTPPTPSLTCRISTFLPWTTIKYIPYCYLYTAVSLCTLGLFVLSRIFYLVTVRVRRSTPATMRGYIRRPTCINVVM